MAVPSNFDQQEEELREAIRDLRARDIVVIYKIDRIARLLKELVEISRAIKL